MFDNYNRNINTLRVSVTSFCNLKCFYCVPNGIKSFNKSNEISIDKIINVIKYASLLGIENIKFTGGEPLVRSDIVQLIRETRKITDIKDISLTTNGVLLSEMAFSLKEAGLDRLNISLDSLDRGKYIKITGYDKLESVINGIKEAINVGFTNIKLNTVLLNGNDFSDIQSIKKFAQENNLKHQTINLMDLKNDKKASENILTEKPPLCSNCSRIRMTSDGMLLPCLFSDDFIDPDDFKTINEALVECIKIKPECGSKALNKSMIDIGG